MLDSLGVKSCRSTVHNWVQKADLQPTDGADPDHVAVDETVLQISVNGSSCTLRSIPRRTDCYILSYLRREIKRLTRCLLLNSVRIISLMTRSFSSILHRGCKQRSTDTISITDTKNMVIGTAPNVFFEN